MSSAMHRGCALLLGLSALVHTAGLVRAGSRDPAMNAAVSAMHAARFSGPGASRSLWDFYFGFNLMLSVWLVFLAALAWQLGRLPGPARQAVRGIEWSLVACLAALAALTWSHFFLAPAAVTTAAAGCAALGAWRSG